MTGEAGSECFKCYNQVMRSKLVPFIEKVISALVIGSLAFAFFPSGIVPTNYNFIYQFVERYEIVGFLLVAFSVPAFLRFIMPVINPGCELVIRNVTNFTLAIGYLFFCVLSVLTYGPFQVNWLNALAVSLISGALYLNSRWVSLYGQQ